MLIRDVELPQALIEAHGAGSLVVFVGAGASVGTPSGLPRFRILAKTIADDAHVEIRDGELDRPDSLLGRIDDADDDVDVHLRVRDLLSSPDS